MEEIKAIKRENNCNHFAKKERRMGKIPGILYGKNMQNILFEIAELEINREISSIGEHGVLDMDLGGEKHKTLIKEVQRDPLTHKVIHIDLEKITADSTINTEVPLIFIGEELVSNNGGILQKEKSKIKIQCKADCVPKSINVNVSEAHYGNTFRICDVEFSSDITPLDDPNSIIAAVTRVKEVENSEKEREPQIAQTDKAD